MPAKAKESEYIGKTINELTVEKFVKIPNKKRTHALCRCSCGNMTVIEVGKLNYGTIKSCGCLKGKGYHKTHELTGTRIHNIWQNFKQRCYNKNNPDYHYYGGRGITVCDEWLNDFIAFYNWSIENGYAENLTIDRRNNDKGYSPDNCRWATRAMQTINQGMKSNNKSGTKGVYYDKATEKWKAQIGAFGKRICVGTYPTIQEAIHARKESELLYWNNELHNNEAGECG